MAQVEDLEHFLGHDLDSNQALVHLSTVTNLVRAYTRGRGFVDGQPNDELDAVILSATARIVNNPTGMVSEQIEDVSFRFAPFRGFNVAEIGVMNRYRQRAV